MINLKNIFRKKVKAKDYPVYKSIDFLPVWNFYEGVIKRKDLRYLLKLEDYSILPTIDFDLQPVWETICKECLEVSTSKDYDTIYLMRGEMVWLRLKYNLLANAITILSVTKEQEIIDLVLKLGYKFENINEDTYYESVINLHSQLKALAKLIEVKTTQLSSEFKKGEDIKFDIYQYISAIEQYKRIQINPFVTTVRQFLSYKKDYEKWINAQKVTQHG